MVSTTTSGNVKRSYVFGPEQMAWLEAEARRRDRTVNWVLRHLVAAAMAVRQSDPREVA